MFGIGGFELVLILLFGFLIFGPDKLPAIAKTVGQAIGKFRRAQEEMSGTLKGQVFDKDADEPFKNPLDIIDEAADKAQKGAKEAKEAAGKAAQKAESFAERKARYDRERAARKAAEKKAAEEKAKAEAEAAAADPAVAVGANLVAEADDAAVPSSAASETTTTAASADAASTGKAE